jgi:putative transposase
VSRSGGTLLLLNVLAQAGDGGSADGPSEVRPRPRAFGPPVVVAQAWEELLLPQPAGQYAFEAVGKPEDGHRGREVRQDVPGLAAELGRFCPGVCARIPRDLLPLFQVPRGEDRVPVCGDENRVGVQDEDAVSAGVYVSVPGHAGCVQLRYNYRLYPAPAQRAALARAFGCARVVFNDGLRLRQHAAGRPYITDGELSAQLTAAKKTPERAWLGEVSAVVLQQALAGLNAAYRNFFASLTAERRSGRVGPPRFRSRKDRRQAIRFTANARFKILPNGRLRLPKIGDVAVRWSRPLPCQPSSVTVIRDAAGRYFASLVVQTDPAADAGRFPQAGREVGIDLGLAAFAVLSDGTKVSAPRFLRRAEKKIRRLQRAHSRKQKGSRNKEKSRARLARAHAAVANRRADFCHQVSTVIIRESQAVYVEDLCVAGLGRTRLAKSVHDAGWSAFVAMLEYKAARYGRTFARTGRFEPTSQVCSACGASDGPKPLSVRTWICAACRTVHDRDVNAARNVLALGRRESLNACGGGVRPGATPAAARETGSLRGAA